MGEGVSKRNTAFYQQRLRAFRPIITPYVIIHLFLVAGLVFVPVGIMLLLISSKIQVVVLDYTECGGDARTPTKHPYNLGMVYNKNKNLCTLKFNVTRTIPSPVFMYYELENFYQAFRPNLSSFSSQQLKGSAIPYEDLGVCSPFVGPEEHEDCKAQRVYYPCGAMANSMFLDKIDTSLYRKDGTIYEMSDKNISWASDTSYYQKTEYSLEDIAIPPAWRVIYNNRTTYKEIPKIWEDEHFMVWMKPSTMNNPRKLYARNDQEDLEPGEYRIEVELYTDVHRFRARKSIVITTNSWFGGKNSFIGFVYLLMGIFSLLISLTLLIWNVLIPRHMGNYTLLSWYSNPKRGLSTQSLGRKRVLNFLFT